MAMLPALLGLLLSTSPAPSGESDVRSLVAAERAFATDAAAHGTRAAFLAVLDDSGVVFNPAPVDGRATWTARAAGTSVLAWEPELAEVAPSGDLGYTTGPWTWRRSPADSVSAAGHYLSVWRREASGTWRLLADIGHSHDEVAPHALVLLRPRAPRPDGSGTPAVDGLEERERVFAARTAEIGPEHALVEALARDGRACREGLLPATGRVAVRALPRPAGTALCVFQSAAASRDGSLGFSRGLVLRQTPDASPDTSTFLRVWRHEGRQWKVAADVELPWSEK